jgi:hypothetical protein
MLLTKRLFARVAVYTLPNISRIFPNRKEPHASPRMMPNAGRQLLPKAGAQRALEAVSCTLLFGPGGRDAHPNVAHTSLLSLGACE